MKASRENDQIVLRLAASEVQFLRRIFASIIRQYLLKPEEVHPRVADVWYSNRGCVSAGLNEEQTREWIENLHHLKSANVAALRRWRRSIAPRGDAIVTLALSDEDSQALLTVLNDHRLMCAARHNIGDEEMSIRTITQIEKLRPRQRGALMDIMFLAAIIETLLALLPGGYGDWPLYAQPE
jgi:hypothetical protein